MMPGGGDERVRNVAVLGSSGHAAAVADALESGGRYRVVGLLDDFEPGGTHKRGHTILGPLRDIAAIAHRCSFRDIAIAVGDNWNRQQLTERLLVLFPEANLVNAIHARAHVSPSACLGRGIVVAPGAIVGPNCRIAEGCIINTSASVDHDSELHAFSSVAPGAHLGGGTRLGPRSAICIGAVLSHRVSVGSDTIVGAGAVVLSDLPDGVVAYGVPARIKRRRRPHDPYL